MCRIHYLGALAILASLLFAPILVWFLDRSPDSISFASVASLAGVMAAACMTATLCLTIRARFLERIFGGLDRYYAVHHLCGWGATVLIAVHVLATGADYYLLDPSLLAELIDIRTPLAAAWLSFALIVLIVVSAALRLRWRALHRLAVPAFAAADYHVAVSSHRPVQTILLVYALAGAGALLCSSLHLPTRRRYTVTAALHDLPGIIRVTLTPRKPGTIPEPGQFIFVAFRRGKSYPACHEFHPFTVVDTAPEDSLTILVKNSGKCTRCMQDLVAGVTADIEGPFGGWQLSAGEQIWIAAGMGAVSFLPMLRNTARLPTHPKLFYVAKEGGHLLLDLLRAVTTHPEAIVPVSSEGNIDDVLQIIRAAGKPLDTVYLSGPRTFVAAMRSRLHTEGTRRIVTESFGQMT